jgi:hypothetical protein
LEPTRFHAEDFEKGCPFGNLPQELLQLILRHLALSSVTPPPSTAQIEPSRPQGRKAKRLTAKEERYRMEAEVGVAHPTVLAGTGRMDVEALERFARVCRAARVATLDEGLWRYASPSLLVRLGGTQRRTCRRLCERTYIPPQPVPSPALLQDYRRCFIEQFASLFPFPSTSTNESGTREDLDLEQTESTLPSSPTSDEGTAVKPGILQLTSLLSTASTPFCTRGHRSQC